MVAREALPDCTAFNLAAFGIEHPRHPRQRHNGGILEQERPREGVERVARYRPFRTVKQRTHRAEPVHILVESILDDHEMVFGKDFELELRLLAFPICRHAGRSQRHGKAGGRRYQARPKLPELIAGPRHEMYRHRSLAIMLPTKNDLLVRRPFSHSANARKAWKMLGEVKCGGDGV